MVCTPVQRLLTVSLMMWVAIEFLPSVLDSLEEQTKAGPSDPSDPSSSSIQPDNGESIKIPDDQSSESHPENYLEDAEEIVGYARAGAPFVGGRAEDPGHHVGLTEVLAVQGKCGKTTSTLGNIRQPSFAVH